MSRDRRRVPRLACRHLSVLSQGGSHYCVEITDINEDGVGLRCSRPLPGRGHLQLSMPGSLFTREIEMVRSAPGDEGYWMGARFLKGDGKQEALYAYLDFVRPQRH